MTEQAKEFIKKRYLSSEDERRNQDEAESTDKQYKPKDPQRTLFVNNQDQLENILSGQEGFPRREINTITSISRVNYGLPPQPQKPQSPPKTAKPVAPCLLTKEQLDIVNLNGKPEGQT